MDARAKFEKLASKQPLAKGDVIFVLQGDGLYRAPHVATLYKEKYAPMCAIVGGADNRPYGSYPSSEVRDEMLAVGEHGPQDVDAATREGDDGLMVAFALLPFARVEGATVVAA